MSLDKEHKPYSFLKKLKKEEKINEEVINSINLLTLEELIALKLEISAKHLNGRLYGLPLMKIMPNIAKQAVIYFAISISTTAEEASKILGIPKSRFRKLLYKEKRLNRIN